MNERYERITDRIIAAMLAFALFVAVAQLALIVYCEYRRVFGI